MRKSLFSMGAAALAIVLMTGAGLRADVIQWSYSPVVPTVSIYNTNNASQTSAINFQGSSGAASGNSGIIIYNVTTAYGPAVSAPDSFTNVPFTLSVQLTDIATSGQNPATATGVVTFSGLFNATNVTKSSMLPGSNTWVLVPGNNSPTEASIVLGAGNTWRTYTVDITSFTPPGQPNGAPGSIQAVVTVTDGGVPPAQGEGTSPSNAPEPSSLVLAGLALPFVVFARRRLKKAQLANNIA